MNNLAEDSRYTEKLKEMNTLLQKWIIKGGDHVELAKTDWGVPVISSWVTDRLAKGKSIDFSGVH
jgi:hypothetical protein